jgi:hypothetical protein
MLLGFDFVYCDDMVILPAFCVIDCIAVLKVTGRNLYCDDAI